jgi:inhibitor of KinA sporulation pathway (predicted exonuclease)
MHISNEYYLIVDVEATCSDIGMVPRGEMEIIEIGAVVQCTRTLEIVSEFETCVRPVRHPELTEFCMRLTGILQSEVDHAPPFADAIAAMQEWTCQFDDALFCSWGDYDRNQFLQDCAFHDVAYPFRSGHLNVKAAYSRSMGLKKKLGLGEALRHAGMRFEGSPHRGLDDARNIARIVRRVCIGV